MTSDFFIFSAADNTLLAGLSPVVQFLKRSNADGSLTDVSAGVVVTDKGGGLYEFTVDDALFTGNSIVSYIIDCTASAASRYEDGHILTDAGLRRAFFLYSLSTGDPTAGLLPTFSFIAARNNATGAITSLAPGPTITDKAGGLYEFTLQSVDNSTTKYVIDATASSAVRFLTDEDIDSNVIPSPTVSNGEALFTVLTADPTVFGLVGRRIYPNQLPEGVDLPAIVYQVVSSVPQNLFDGAPSLRQVRMQLDVYARPTVAGGGGYLQAQAVAKAVESALGALSSPSMSAWLESSRDLFDNDSQYHRVSMDFSIW